MANAVISSLKTFLTFLKFFRNSKGRQTYLLAYTKSEPLPERRLNQITATNWQP